VDIFNGSTPKKSESKFWDDGSVPWFTVDDIRTQGRIISSTLQLITQTALNETSVKLLPKESVLLCCTASLGEYAFTQVEVTTNQQFNGLVVRDKNILLPKYLYWCVSTFKSELERMSGKATFGFVSVGALKEFEIPLPPLEVQELIVAELDGYAAIISGAKQIVENWKPSIDVDPEWEIKPLGSVAEVISGQSPEGKFYNDRGEGTPFYQGKTEFSDLYIGPPTKWTTQVTKLAEPDDILMSVRAPVGPVNLTSETICIGRGLAAIRAKSINRDYLFAFLVQNESKIHGNGGAVFDSITRLLIEQLEIPLPPRDVQDDIASAISHERAQIDSAKKLIETYEARTQTVIAKLWSE
jgi:restriction endonuclease S subunit